MITFFELESPLLEKGKEEEEGGGGGRCCLDFGTIVLVMVK